MWGRQLAGLCTRESLLGSGGGGCFFPPPVPARLGTRSPQVKSHVPGTFYLCPSLQCPPTQRLPAESLSDPGSGTGTVSLTLAAELLAPGRAGWGVLSGLLTWGLLLEHPSALTSDGHSLGDGILSSISGTSQEGMAGLGASANQTGRKKRFPGLEVPGSASSTSACCLQGPGN